jgi:hypothetical protein
MVWGMTAIVEIQGVKCAAYISCHRNGTFSYHINGKWETSRTVPHEVLYDPIINDDERYRVLSRMDALGVVPS